MKIVKLLFQLLIALYFAKFLADSIVFHRHINYMYFINMGVLFIGSYILLKSSLRFKFILFALLIFFPLIIRTGLPLKSIVEGLAPILLVFSILENVKSGQSFFSKKAFIYFAAIGILALWSLIHYILNPVIGQQTFGARIQSGGIRNYYLVFAGISTFFCSYWFFKKNEINADKYFHILLIICLLLGALYLIDTFSGISILYFFDLGGHGEIHEKYQYSNIALRTIAAYSTSVLLSLYHNKKWGGYFNFAFILIIVFIIFGGGRSSLPVLSLVIIGYVTLINRKYLFPVMAVLLIGWGIYVLTLSNVTFSEYKFGRAFKVEGGLKEQDAGRYYTFLYMYEVFKKSPLLGKGIGHIDLTSQNEFFKEHPEARLYIRYVQAQSMLGGHGTYMSILSIFGIGGFFWLMTLLYGGIYHSYRFIKINDRFDDSNTKIAIFVLTQLLTLAISYYVGGNGGYDDMKFWFLAGIIAGLISKDKVEKGSELPDGYIISPEMTARSI